MKITIIYSNPGEDAQLSSLSAAAEEICNEKHELMRRFNLAEQKLKFCTGCWSCWWKTPGVCAISDGIPEIYKAVMNSDLILFISSLEMGAITSELKTFIERMVALIHPYTTMIEGEVHHHRRYDHYPEMAVILGDENDTDETDREINEGYFQRMVKNFYSSVKFVRFSGEIGTEDVYELLAD